MWKIPTEFVFYKVDSRELDAFCVSTCAVYFDCFKTLLFRMFTCTSDQISYCFLLGFYIRASYSKFKFLFHVLLNSFKSKCMPIKCLIQIHTNMYHKFLFVCQFMSPFYIPHVFNTVPLILMKFLTPFGKYVILLAILMLSG